MKATRTTFLLAIILLISLNLKGQEIIKKNLSDSINSAFTETKPMISPDGEILYFARQNYPDNVDGEYDDQDIYYSKYSYNGWSKAKNIGRPLNNEMPNGIVSVFQSGMSLLLLNSYEDKEKQEGIAVTHLSDSGWTEPNPIEIRDFHNHSQYVDYFLSANGQEMLIAVERDDSFGDQDLYVSKKMKNGGWSKPINLGSKINTKEPEFSPFLAADNKTLFFSSMGHDGFGGADVYYSKRLDTTWTNWSEPENLGPDVNTKGFEAYYTIPNDGTIGYYVSSEGGIEDSRDIFSITLPYRFRPEPVILLKGKLVQGNKLSDSSEFSVNFLTDMSSESEIFVEYDDGEFDALLPTGGNYFFYTNKSGFISESHYIDLSSQKEYAEETADIHLISIKKGEKFVSHNLQFEDKSAELLPSSYFELVRLLEIFQNNKGLQIEMTAHAFDFEDSIKNDSLAIKRVEVIKSFYEDQGLAEGKFVTKSAGSTIPSPAGYREHLNSHFNINNRISFTILDTSWEPHSKEDMILVTVAEYKTDKTNTEINTSSQDTLASFYFDFDSYQLNMNEDKLASVINKIKNNQIGSVKLVGLTCDYGNPIYNKALAQRRADFILKKILEKYQDSSVNIVTETKPNVSSTITSGESIISARKKNRRVDIIINNTTQSTQANLD